MAANRRSRREESKPRTGVLVGIAGAALAALLVYQVFVRSDDTQPTASSGSPAAGVATSTTTLVPQEPTLPNGSFDELSLRDPFEPPFGSGDDGGGTPTSSTSSTTIPGTIPTTPTTSPAQNPAPKTDIALEDIIEANGVSTARIRVGGDEYSVLEGQVFAINYKLVAFTSATCVTLQYADSPFSLCEGEQVYK